MRFALPPSGSFAAGKLRAMVGSNQQPVTLRLTGPEAQVMRMSPSPSRGMQLKPLALAVLCMAVGTVPAACRRRRFTTAARRQHAGYHAVSGAGGRQPPDRQVVPVAYRGGHYCLTPQRLIDAGLPVTSKRMKEIAVDQLDKVDVTYSGETQRLLISVPNDWLPRQTLSDASPEQRLPKAKQPGLLAG